jgi:hypothetical protein
MEEEQWSGSDLPRGGRARDTVRCSREGQSTGFNKGGEGEEEFRRCDVDGVGRSRDIYSRVLHIDPRSYRKYT